jgi:hypothetical protein
MVSPRGDTVAQEPSEIDQIGKTPNIRLRTWTELARVEGEGYG